MANLTVSTDIDSFMQSANNAAARAALGVPSTNSPALTGVPTSPTAAAGTNTTQIATTEFVQSNKGDRYRTSSTTSNAISLGGKTFTVEAGLSYTRTQDITMVADASNHMHGQVLTYSGTTLTVNVTDITGTGTFTSWTINVGGVIGGTALQVNNNLSDVQSASASLVNIGGVSTARQISAGTGLTGGGDLTSDRTLSLETISGLPTGAQGSSTIIPQVTVDSTGRVTALTTAQLASYVLTSDLTTAATANKVPQLDGTGKLSTAQVPALTTAQIAQITPSGIGAVAVADLTKLATANKVPQLDSAGKLSTAQVPALTTSQIAQITPAGIGAVATSSLTTAATANGVPQLTASGTLATDQLATISGLPVGIQGSASVIPAVTVDAKGRVTAISTNQLSVLSSQAANVVFAGPNGSTGQPTFRSLVKQDVPQLDQNTSGTAAGLSATLAVASGGTGQTTYTNGDLLIGNTAGGLSKAKLTGAGTVTITNGDGAITITGSGGGGGTVTTTGTPAVGSLTKFSSSTSIENATAGTDYQAPIGTISGIVKGAGANALTAATAGTDYLAPFGSQTQKTVYAAPNAVDGTPSFRALVSSDLPIVEVLQGGTGQTTNVNARYALGGIQNATIRHGSALVLQPAGGTAGQISGASWSSTVNPTQVAYTNTTIQLVVGMSLGIVIGVSSNAVITGFVSGTGAPGSAGTLSISLAVTTTLSGQTVTAYNSTVSTLVSSSIVSMDGRTMQVGDVVLLTAQPANAQNGPWILNSLVGSVMSFVRPSYWTGTILGNSLFYIQQGTANYGQTVSVSGASPNGSSVGVDSFSVYTATQRGSNAVTGSNNFSGTQTFMAGTTGVVPAKFSASSVLITTPLANAIEWDNTSMYLTNSSAVRSPVLTELTFNFGTY